MALSNPYADLERRDFHLTEWRFHIYSKENGFGTSCKDLRAIQRSDQKLWPFQTRTLISIDATST
jgi:hypothetical protein